MIVVATIKIQVTPRHLKELTQTLSSLSRAVRGGTGCIGCQFYQQVDETASIMWIEEWASEEDWKIHLRSAEFAVLLGAMSLSDDAAGLQFKLLGEGTSLQELKEFRVKLSQAPSRASKTSWSSSR